MAAVIVVVALEGSEAWKRVPVKESDTWETFLAKVCTKLSIDAVHSVLAESDGAEVEDVEELMTGDKLVVRSADGGAQESKQPAPAVAAGAPESQDPPMPPSAVAIDEAALSLRKRNGAGEVAACLRLVQKLVNNARKPEAKFRSVRLTRSKIASSVARHPQGIAMLAAAGFVPAQEGLTPPAAGVGKDTAPAPAAGSDDPTPESLGLTHAFMVLPLGQSVTLTVEELAQVMDTHLAWADRHTSTVAGSASYNMAKRELAKVRAAHGVHDAGSVPSDERWKLYPVYLAAKAQFDKRCETAAPVPRLPEVSDDPHTRGAVVGVGEVAAAPEPAPLGAAASTGGDMSQEDIVAQLGGAEGLGAAQALLTAAGGPTSQAMAKARKAAGKLNKLTKYADTGARVRLVFPDLVTIVARFSPYETAQALQDFLVTCLAPGSPPPAALWAYNATADKKKAALKAPCLNSASAAAPPSPAFTPLPMLARLGTESLAPGGTVVVVWSTPTPSPPQGQYLAPHLQAALRTTTTAPAASSS